MPCEGVYAVVVAAGRGERLGAGVNKVFLPIDGRSVLLRSLDAFALDALDGVVLVVAEGDMERCLAEVERTQTRVLAIVAGGATRLHSVKNGLDALPGDASVVLVHDAARPFATRDIIEACIASVLKHGSGVAGCALTDTVRQVDADGRVTALPERDALRAVQTPQGFRADWLRDAYDRAVREGWEATDDIGVAVRAGYTARVVECAPGNVKITAPDDLLMARIMHGGIYRVGTGFDVHRLVEGRRLVLCGADIPFDRGLLGHSDADVAVHALMDALLGAACLGDIGMLYPDTDERFKGASSIALLEDTVKRVAEAGFAVANADITIAAQRPKLAPYREVMRTNIIGAIGCEHINVKMTTTEGLGFEGRGEGISAQAAAMLVCLNR